MTMIKNVRPISEKAYKSFTERINAVAPEPARMITALDLYLSGDRTNYADALTANEKPAFEMLRFEIDRAIDRSARARQRAHHRRYAKRKSTDYVPQTDDKPQNITDDKPNNKTHDKPQNKVAETSTPKLTDVVESLTHPMLTDITLSPSTNNATCDITLSPDTNDATDDDTAAFIKAVMSSRRMRRANDRSKHSKSKWRKIG